MSLEYCYPLKEGEILNQENLQYSLFFVTIHGSEYERTKLSKRLVCAVKHLPLRLTIHYEKDIEKSIEIGVRKDPTLTMGKEILVEGLVSAEKLTEIFQKLLKINQEHIKEQKMKNVIIVGAGFAGLHVFYKIRHLIGEKIKLTVIDSRSHSLLKPSLPEVSFEGAPISHSLVELKHTIESKGATFIQDEITNIDADKNELSLKNGNKLEYDYIFITVGAIKDYDAIKGFREYGYSVCDDIQAQRLWQRVKDFKGGKIVTGAAKSTWGRLVEAPLLKAPCEGPIGEIMFMLDYYLSNEKNLTRGKDFSIDVFTPGEIFFEDVGDNPRNAVGQVMQERNISLHNNKVVTEIGEDFVKFEDGSSLSSNLTIIIPPYTAPEVIKNSNIGDEKGFIPTDKQMRHLEYKNIFSAGDITALAQPKLGHVAIIQAGIAAATFMNDIGEDVEIPPHDLEVFCIMNMGGHDATLILSNVLYNGNIDKAIHSPLAKMMKWGFDNYLYYNKGHMPPDFAMDMTDKILKIL